MTSQSPAEALRQKILAYVGYGADDVKFADEIMAGVTAYAATVEREAELQGFRTTSTVLQYVIDADSGFEGDSKTTAMHWKNQTEKLIEELLAALQGPQDGAMLDRQEEE